MTAPEDFDFGAYSSSGASSKFSSDLSFEQSTGTGTGSHFDSDPDASAAPSFESAGPPVLWMWGGIAAALAGTVIAVLAGAVVPLAWSAWALAGPIAIGLYSVFSLRDTKQRAKPLYGERSGVTWIFRFGWLLAFAGVVASALRLADWAGRL